jgi:succinoglycan biosynthesis transport protein ExoP
MVVGIVCAGLAYGLSGILPARYASDGLLLIEAAKDPTAQTMNRLTDSDLLRSPSLLLSVVAALNLAQRPDLIPALRLPAFVGDAVVALDLAHRPILVSSLRLPEIVTEWLKALQSPRKSAADRGSAALAYLQRHLIVTSDDNSRVLSIHFEAGTPDLAASVINELMKRYIAADYQAKQDLAAHASGWLSKQLKTSRQEADTADQRVEAFQKAHYLVSLQEGTLAALDLNRLLEQLSTATQELVEAQAAFDMAKADGGQSLSSSPVAQALRQRESDIIQRLAAAGSSMGNNSPTHVAIEGELRAVRGQIVAENSNSTANLAGRLLVAKARVDSTQADVRKASASAVGSSENQFELERLTQTAQAMHAAYNALLSHMQDTQFAANQVTAARIISPAAPPTRRQPSRTPINVVLGLLAGCLLSIGFFLLRNLLAARVGSAMRLAEISGVPTLGTLPALGRRRMAVLAIDQPRCAVAETLRGIRLAIQITRSSNVSSVVLVSSAERGEGKTSVAAALALRAADDGMRVLLIEGDLHRPRLADELGMPAPSRGLEAALSATCCQDSVLQVHSRSSLHCLLATGSAANPIALLDSKAFAKLITDARSTYDLIVIDGPPVLRVADAVVLSRWADHIVLVVRADRTQQRRIVEALSRFPPEQQPLLVTLLTGARANRLSIEGFYTGYGEVGKSRVTHSNDATRPALQSRGQSSHKFY